MSKIAVSWRPMTRARPNSNGLQQKNQSGGARENLLANLRDATIPVELSKGGLATDFEDRRIAMRA